MSVLEVLRWPDPRLAEICAPIEEITPEIEQLAADMLETMYAAPGRGLAGPQVGAMLRIFVMDAGWKEDKSDP
ncbi:MAG TPA: peptide deformylase, partial [Sulfitobacter sp.]|nr:peptide deformylase [Sulfitobacter sp.]